MTDRRMFLASGIALLGTGLAGCAGGTLSGGWVTLIDASGQVPALSEHFFNIDVTKFQRYPNTHGAPWNRLFGRG